MCRYRSLININPFDSGELLPINERQIISSNGSILIRKISPRDDAGFYKCQVKGGGKNAEATAQSGFQALVLGKQMNVTLFFVARNENKSGDFWVTHQAPCQNRWVVIFTHGVLLARILFSGYGSALIFLGRTYRHHV